MIHGYVTFLGTLHLSCMTAKTGNNLSAYELSLISTEELEVKKTVLLKQGVRCPECKLGTLEYNGLLELECSQCDYRVGNTGGCT